MGVNRIDLGDGSFTTLGRIKRDFAQRTGHEIHHAIRGQEFHGPNISNTVEGPHLHPKAEKIASDSAHLAALKDMDHSSGGSMYDFILGELNNNLPFEEINQDAMDNYVASLDDYFMDGEEPPPPPEEMLKLNHLPNIRRSYKAKIKARMKEEGISESEALVEELR